MLDREMAITGSRIMVRFSYMDEDMMAVRKIVAWNWKTGERVRFSDLVGHTLFIPLFIISVT